MGRGEEFTARASERAPDPPRVGVGALAESDRFFDRITRNLLARAEPVAREPSRLDRDGDDDEAELAVASKFGSRADDSMLCQAESRGGQAPPQRPCFRGRSSTTVDHDEVHANVEWAHTRIVPSSTGESKGTRGFGREAWLRAQSR